MYIYILMYGEKIDNEGTPGKTDELWKNDCNHRFNFVDTVCAN